MEILGVINEALVSIVILLKRYSFVRAIALRMKILFVWLLEL
ncbi:hypothetical protein [Okeania sp. SIO1I7]|nr:hypothetical protein [Okeania sp. SIO1I7]